MYSIAKKYNTTVEALKNQNQLTNNNLTIGQTITIPSSSTSNLTYTVKPGDTLYRIASQNNTTVDILKKLNNIANDTLTIGQIIKLPSTELIQIPTTTTTYTVKKGDTLYSIAKNYNTTTEKIKSLNNLSTNNLTIGQQLKIPSTTTITKPTTTTTYTVKPGDTLYSLAREFNTTVNNLKTLNNLTTNNLTIGQTILIN